MDKLRPREGLDLACCSHALLNFKAKYVEDKLRINNIRNIVVVSMSSLE